MEIFSHHFWLLWSAPLVHVERLLGAHDDVYRYGKGKPVHHLCDLLLWNAMFVPPGRNTTQCSAVSFHKFTCQHRVYKVFLSLCSKSLYNRSILMEIKVVSLTKVCYFNLARSPW